MTTDYGLHIHEGAKIEIGAEVYDNFVNLRLMFEDQAINLFCRDLDHAKRIADAVAEAVRAPHVIDQAGGEADAVR